MSLYLRRLPALTEQLGCSRAHCYQLIKDGLLMKPIRLSARSVAWPSNELQQYVQAKIAGASKDELRALVQQLETARTADREAA